MGNDISSQISQEDIIEIKKKQILLEQQNKKIKHDLKKEKHTKEILKNEIDELKSKKKAKQTLPNNFSMPKNSQTIPVTINNSIIQVDPFLLFNLEPECSLDDIKKVYKKLVLQYHPDKSGYNSTDDYRVIQKAYAVLLSMKEEELKVTGLLEQTIETKGEERKKLDTHVEARTNYNFEPASGNRFDKKKFNDMFDQNKFVDKEDDGYSNWLKEENPAEELPKIQTFTKTGFNNTFEQHVQKHSNNKEISNYIDPDSYFTYKGGFENLGEDVNDYTTDGKYTDLKKAYSSNNTLHPGQVKQREEYSNLGQLKAARDAPVEISQEEKEFISNRQKLESEFECNRVTRMRDKDKKIEDFYSRIHGRAIELPNYGGARK